MPNTEMARTFTVYDLAESLPHVQIFMGPERACDNTGSPYIKLTFGGQVEEGELIASTQNISDAALWTTSS